MLHNTELKKHMELKLGQQPQARLHVQTFTADTSTCFAEQIDTSFRKIPAKNLFLAPYS